jgi:hypothetical protein
MLAGCASISIPVAILFPVCSNARVTVTVFPAVPALFTVADVAAVPFTVALENPAAKV